MPNIPKSVRDSKLWNELVLERSHVAEGARTVSQFWRSHMVLEAASGIFAEAIAPSDVHYTLSSLLIYLITRTASILSLEYQLATRCIKFPWILRVKHLVKFIISNEYIFLCWKNTISFLPEVQPANFSVILSMHCIWHSISELTGPALHPRTRVISIVDPLFYLNKYH